MIEPSCLVAALVADVLATVERTVVGGRPERRGVPLRSTWRRVRTAPIPIVRASVRANAASVEAKSLPLRLLAGRAALVTALDSSQQCSLRYDGLVSGAAQRADQVGASELAAELRDVNVHGSCTSRIGDEPQTRSSRRSRESTAPLFEMKYASRSNSFAVSSSSPAGDGHVSRLRSRTTSPSSRRCRPAAGSRCAGGLPSSVRRARAGRTAW